MMVCKERHIVPNKDRCGWDSKRENAERVSKNFEIKKEAMGWSIEKTKEEGSELIPHKIGLMQMKLTGKKRLKI